MLLVLGVPIRSLLHNCYVSVTVYLSWTETKVTIANISRHLVRGERNGTFLELLCLKDLRLPLNA